MIYAGYFVVGAVFGITFMIILSVIAVSGKQSDEEYRRELERMKEHAKDEE